MSKNRKEVEKILDFISKREIEVYNLWKIFIYKISYLEDTVIFYLEGNKKEANIYSDNFKIVIFLGPTKVMIIFQKEEEIIRKDDLL